MTLGRSLASYKSTVSKWKTWGAGGVSCCLSLMLQQEETYLGQLDLLDERKEHVDVLRVAELKYGVLPQNTRSAPAPSRKTKGTPRTLKMPCCVGAGGSLLPIILARCASAYPFLNDCTNPPIPSSVPTHNSLCLAFSGMTSSSHSCVSRQWQRYS